MLKIRDFFLIVAVFLIVANSYALMRTIEPTSKEILATVPLTATFKHITDPIDCYRLFDSKGNPVGVALITTSVPPEVTGYRDEISVLVGINESGEITGTKLLGHQDSPELMSNIISKGFLKRFIGRNPRDNWDDIETITGATISSAAIKEDIRTAATAAHEKVLKSSVLTTDKKKEDLTSRRLDRPTAAAIVVSILIILSIIAIFIPKILFLRLASLFISFVTIGVLFNTPLTIGNLMDACYGYLPQINNLALLLILIFAISSAFLKGPLYCSYLCPFGAMQDAASAIKLPKIQVDEKAIRYARLFRWIIMAAIIIATVAFNLESFKKIEPFALCFARDVKTAVWIQVGVILAAALFFRRPWCRLFCPTGLVLETLSRLGTKVRCRFKCKSEGR